MLQTVAAKDPSTGAHHLHKQCFWFSWFYKKKKSQRFSYECSNTLKSVYLFLYVYSELSITQALDNISRYGMKLCIHMHFNPSPKCFSRLITSRNIQQQSHPCHNTSLPKKHCLSGQFKATRSKPYICWLHPTISWLVKEAGGQYVVNNLCMWCKPLCMAFFPFHSSATCIKYSYWAYCWGSVSFQQLNQ